LANLDQTSLVEAQSTEWGEHLHKLVTVDLIFNQLKKQRAKTCKHFLVVILSQFIPPWLGTVSRVLKFRVTESFISMDVCKYLANQQT
jgi:hypothetical protein